MRRIIGFQNCRAARAGRAALVLVLLILPLVGCGASDSQPAQSPSAYLGGALDWIGAHSARAGLVPWASIRKQAAGMARHPHKIADTYPAIIYALEQLHDPIGFFLDPHAMAQGRDDGILTMYPERLVVDVEPGSPAQHAGVRVGDVIEAVNGRKPHAYQGSLYVDLGRGARDRVTVRHPGQARPVAVNFAPAQIGNASAPCAGVPHGRQVDMGGHRLGYIALPLDCGSDAYPTTAQQVLKAAAPACGWVVDLRQNSGGDVWTYLAAVGPILGNGKVGGFLYRDGTREWWEYRNGKVFWNGQEREEDKVKGSRLHVTGSFPPVAILTSRATTGAAELLDVAFHGRPHSRSFGEPTRGAPSLSTHTVLSDGSLITLSGSDSFDRSGHVYRGSIAPDKDVPVNWGVLGTSVDPVLRDATQWLRGQPGCR